MFWDCCQKRLLLLYLRSANHSAHFLRQAHVQSHILQNQQNFLQRFMLERRHGQLCGPGGEGSPCFLEEAGFPWEGGPLFIFRGRGQNLGDCAVWTFHKLVFKLRFKQKPNRLQKQSRKHCSTTGCLPRITYKLHLPVSQELFLSYAVCTAHYHETEQAFSQCHYLN